MCPCPCARGKVPPAQPKPQPQAGGKCGSCAAPCGSKPTAPPRICQDSAPSHSANAPTSPKKRKPCGPQPCDGSTCGKCPKNVPVDKGKDSPDGFGGFSAPPNNRGPVALGLAALLFAAGVFLTTKLGIVANEIG